jgi:hypothetical protein
MIAVSAIKGKYLTCDESRVEAHYRSGEIEIFVPARVDLAACLRDGVTTIKLQVVRQTEVPTAKAQTIDQINQGLLANASLKRDVAASTEIVASRDIDISKLVPNSLTRGRSFSSLSIDEVRALFTPTTAIIPSQTEAVNQSNSEKRVSDRESVLNFVEPGSQNRGSLPLDTVSSLSANSPDARMGVRSLPVGAPKTSLVLADSSRVSVSLRVSLAGSKKTLSGCKIKVVVNARGVEAQSIQLKPDFTSLIEQTSLPVSPPKVCGSRNAVGRAVISVTQTDDLADTVSVAVRDIKDYVTPIRGFETVLDRVKCTKGETVTLQLSLASDAVVRVYPTSSDKLSPVYGSTVIGKVRRGPVIHSTTSRSFVVAVNVSQGISIDFRTSDEKAYAVLLRRRDIRSNTVTPLTSSPVLVETATGIIDEGVEDLAVVQYEADLYRSNGDVIKSAARSEKVTRLEPRQIVDASITVTPVTTGNQVVQITISPTVKQTDVDILIQYISALGIETAFQTDLESLRKSLLNCVKFDVTRYDLITGDIKYVGQTSGQLTDDIDDVKISSNFLYLFEAFVRSPSQLTDVITDRSNRPTGISPKITKLGLHITKSDVDKINTRQSDLSVARRFFSRSNFETGTMPSSPASDGFEDGRTGDTFVQRITVSPALPTVSRLIARVSKGKPIISWTSIGDASLIDRYVVEASSSGSTWTVVSAGVAGTSATLQVTDEMSYSLPRYITYAVYPVYLDGKSGAAASSLPVLLERTRVI